MIDRVIGIGAGTVWAAGFADDCIDGTRPADRFDLAADRAPTMSAGMP
ncbi:MAG: hypothetical protein OYH76_07295 [Defluviicoccus sp.]|nr:hypothetical protein [Defluviicoccus sp.]MDE0275684.1 hypothetical protein [Defluviicoccus sp.]